MTLKGIRTCRRCKIEKTLVNFEEYTRKYGIAHRVVCKDCADKARSIISITCQICDIEKNTSEFPKSNNALVGFEMTCKNCKKEQQIKSGKFEKVNRDRKGRYASDPKFRESLKNHSKMYRMNNKAKHMLSQARIRARNKDLPFNIEVSDIIIPTHCPILNIKLSINNKKRLWDSASLDKVDNTKGYVKGNIRVISYLANHIKGKATREELKLFAKNIIPYLDGMI